MLELLRSATLAVLAVPFLAAAVHAQTFGNAGPITIQSGGAATPYPSDILVSGVAGTVDAMTVTLSGLSHTWPTDVDILLVGPAGQNVILMSDTGGIVAVSGLTFVFDDGAAQSLSTSPLTSGAYRPTNLAGTGSDLFPAPAPVLSGATALATFAGTNPNGIWSLFVLDDSAGDAGTIESWSITLPAPGAAGQAAALVALLALRFRGRGGRRG
jgi:subtilisin-like proprotein convertase family protein